MRECESYLGLISASLDGALTEEERGELDRHLADCPDCRRTWEQFSAMEHDLMELESPSPDFTDRILAAAAREEQEIPFTNLPQNRPAGANARTHMRAWWRPIRSWGLVAVCLVLVIGVGFRLVSTGWFTRSSDGAASPQAVEEDELVPETAELAPEAEEPLLTLDGVQYLPGDAVEELPEGYELAGILEEDMAGGTDLAGALYAANGTDGDLYVALPEGGWQQWVPNR